MKNTFVQFATVGALLVGASFVGVSVAGAQTIPADKVMIDDGKFSKSLTGAAGDPVKGRKTFANRKLGNCLACHVNMDLADQPFHGEIGPSLDGVAERYDEATLRAILIDSKKVLGEDTMMPSFYRLENGYRTKKKFLGKTILNAEQIEDVLAYIKTLK